MTNEMVLLDAYDEKGRSHKRIGPFALSKKRDEILLWDSMVRLSTRLFLRIFHRTYSVVDLFVAI